jgi:hypothetical protein
VVNGRVRGIVLRCFFLKIGIFLFNLGMIFSDCEVMKSGWWLCLVCIDALAVYCVVVVFDPAQEQ